LSGRRPCGEPLRRGATASSAHYGPGFATAPRSSARPAWRPCSGGP